MNEFCAYHQQYSALQAQKIAREFNRLSDEFYLEHAGTTLYSEKQVQEISRHLCSNIYANPHAGNLSSKQTGDAIDIIRYQILTHFNTNPDEYSVVFTSGATAALKLIAENFFYDKGVFAYLQDNHTSVLGMRAYAPAVKCLKIDQAFDIFQQTGITGSEGNSLFAFPAQSNFSGAKYPVAWIEQVRKGALNKHFHMNSNWFVVLDAASYVSTSPLDLTKTKPDFVTISFYKIFGAPAGLGALLVKNSSCYTLRKRYYGGGTVLMAQSVVNEVVMREIIHEKFEDGTVPFLSILALREGFNTFKRLDLTLDLIAKHTFSLARYVYSHLICLHHSNGSPVAVLYHNSTFESSEDQGPIVNFNILRDNGQYVGYAEVLHFANLYGIHLRTGCFCNPGACQYHLKLTSEDVKRHFDAGHVCGDQHDLVDSYPTGSVRVSFGYMSTKKEADKFLEMIENCFVTEPAVRKIPDGYNTPKRNNYSLPEPEPNLKSSGVLQQIILYPVKSCGGFNVDKWSVTATGLNYDRQWMIINSSQVCLTQKNYKNMCMIRPIVDLENNILILTYPDTKKISVPIAVETNLEKCATLCHSKVCGDKIQGWDCGDEVADWLTDIFQIPVRLLKQYEDRTFKENLQLSLANKAQYLLVNTKSVEWLRQRTENFDEALSTTIQRFRPNFVVDFEAAFVENQVQGFWLGGIKFEFYGICTRCQMICIDQTTGKATKEPLQTLSKSFKGKINFGVYLNRSECTEECIYTGSRISAEIK